MVIENPEFVHKQLIIDSDGNITEITVASGESAPFEAMPLHSWEVPAPVEEAQTSTDAG
jgi:hypothetical protein